MKKKIKNKILVSIICRSYNGEKYIYSALTSLSKYFKDDCEVIVVDNGSRDKTIQKIKYFKKKSNFDFKLKLIQQKNSGPGGSCNTGLDHSRGKYIGFLDCDDIFLNNIKFVLRLVSQKKADIIDFGFLTFSNKAKLGSKKFKGLYDNFDGKYLTKDILNLVFARTNWYPFIRFYKKELWKNIRFPENVAYEDDMTLYKVFLKSKSIYLLNKPVLAYRQHQQSITSNHTEEQLNNLVNLYWNLKISGELKKIFRLRLARAISYFCFELKKGTKQYKKILKSQKKIYLTTKSLRVLKKIDLFYYFFPRFYNFLNWFRLNLIR